MSKTENPIPPWQRIAVDATTAAQMMSCSRSTFFQRVKDGIYPKSWDDGLWRVEELRAWRPAANQEPATRAA